MTIQVYGSGCPSCTKLFDRTKQAVQELNIEAELEYISDIQKIIDLGLMSSPVLVRDGQVLMAGQLPSVEKLKEILAK